MNERHEYLYKYLKEYQSEQASGFIFVPDLLKYIEKDLYLIVEAAKHKHDTL